MRVVGTGWEGRVGGLGVAMEWGRSRGLRWNGIWWEVCRGGKTMWGFGW